MSLLIVKDLSVEFQTESGYVKAVDDVSFSLNNGETLGIVGESGSGKSVTALSIIGLISKPGKITSGEIILNKDKVVDLLKLNEKQMQKVRGNEIGMIFQEPMTSLNPVMKCGNQVMESILLHSGVSKKFAKKRTIELFNEVQLPRPESIFNSYPHQISGGQKQRVMIAIAMSCNPAILIADEPTTALDVTVQKKILELMLKIQQIHDLGIIFITHDLGVIGEIADKVIVMHEGKIVEQAPVKEIFNNPQHAYTKGLLACRPSLTKRYKVLPTIAELIKNPEGVSGNIVTKEERKKNHGILYSKNPVLKVRHVKTFFPLRKNILGKTLEYVKAVDDVSFDVYPGETLGLVGESGCGKTSLGRSILGLIGTDGGEILYEGLDITKISYRKLKELRKDIQIIFQDPYSSLNPRITVGSAIMEPMKVHNLNNNDKKRKEKTIELLEQVNMEPQHFYRYPHEFSGGQRQRICIARALAVEPKFIICDESVSALDVSVQAQVLNLLNRLKEEYNLTYIFISHDLSVVKFMSDKMIVMKDGKIVEAGEADSVYSNPESEHTNNLIEAIPKGIRDAVTGPYSYSSKNFQ